MLKREEVLRIARLARLTLSEDEIALYQERIGRVLEHINELNEVQTPDNDTVRHVPKDAVAFREDRAVPFEGWSDLLANAPAVEDDHFLLPQVMD